MEDDNWEEIRELANNTMQLYLGDNTLWEVINEMDPVDFGRNWRVCISPSL